MTQLLARAFSEASKLPDVEQDAVASLLLAEIALPSDARAILSDRLAESLDSAEDNSLKQLWAAEAQRRMADVRSGRVKTIPGEEALARVRSAIAQ